MNAKPTPGPWFVTGSCEYGTMICDNTGKSIANWPVMMRATDLADARLIAAAPDLLEACENMEKIGMSIRAESVIWKDIRAALAKAGKI